MSDENIILKMAVGKAFLTPFSIYHPITEW
jgi:hypothetical protein